MISLATPELRRMDFERRRKELEEMQKKTKTAPGQRQRKPKKQKDADGQGGPTKKRRKNANNGNATAAMPGVTPPATAGVGAIPPAPSVAQKSPTLSSAASTPQKDEPDYVDLIMRGLRGLPLVSLQEPLVSINHHAGKQGIWPVQGFIYRVCTGP